MKAQTEAAADVFEQAATNWKKANQKIHKLQTMMTDGNPIFKKRIPIRKSHNHYESKESSGSSEELSSSSGEELESENPSKSRNQLNESFNEMKHFSPSNNNNVVMNQKRIGVNNLHKKSKKPKYNDDTFVKTAKQIVAKSETEIFESLPELKSKKVPKNVYLYFVSQRFADVKAEFPNLQMTDVNGKIAEMWKTLPAEEKESFRAEFHAQQQKYGNGGTPSKEITSSSKTHISSPESSKLISASLKSSIDSPKLLSTAAQKKIESNSQNFLFDSSIASSSNSFVSTPQKPYIGNQLIKDTEIKEYTPQHNESDDDKGTHRESPYQRSISTSTFNNVLVASQNEEVPWILPIVGTPTSFGLSPYRKRKIRKSSFSDYDN
ncbi:9670_t:CDS:2 [Ambispora gerdemannii]|uniref:9670_t:CDS:1 n=1 Tax=Ambispora gerdemannii TaxID=144530 RepID=A0A9N9A5T2_9GLOM|nr:9670_t:CDS:2 [Ambispora gerdemannii]